MQKTAEQIARDVLKKLAFKLPGLALLQAVGKANKNPGDLALRAGKVQALRGASDSFRELERNFRRPSIDLSPFFGTRGSGFSGGKLAEVDALPPSPETPTELDAPVQVPHRDLRLLREDLAKQKDVFGEGALLRSSPSPELQRALERIQPSTKDKWLYGAGGALGGAALMGGTGALVAALKRGTRQAVLKNGILGAGTGALGGALGGLHMLQKRRIGDAIRETYDA
jgi:hypothetical protein